MSIKARPGIIATEFIVSETTGLAECKPCRHSRIYGHYLDAVPNGYSHCRRCHTTFRGGERMCHCTGCCATFSGVTAFEQHRVNGACLTDAEIEQSTRGETSQRAFEKDEYGVWHRAVAS